MNADKKKFLKTDIFLSAFIGVHRRPIPKKSFLVGLGRVELPTSPLSGVRSSHLSYRPMGLFTGGAGRDRTGDLLNANQALSQLSYSPAFFPRPIGRSDRKTLPFDLKGNHRTPSGDPVRDSLFAPKSSQRFMEWNGCELLIPTNRSLTVAAL
jgi:hypothetical protein